MSIRTKLLILLSTSLPHRPSSAFRAASISRQSLAAFSSSAVSHGGHATFSVFPKLDFWIIDASQFNTQSVVKEGCGEAALAESKDRLPWPEWSKLADVLLEKGHSDGGKASGHDDDSFFVDEDLPEEFLKAAEACLGFARDRPDILRLLSKRNVEAVVLNGPPPLLFKNGEDSASRMRLFLNVEGETINQELELGKAETVDIMRYLLSYVYGSLSLSAGKDLRVEEPVERSVRKLLVELFNLSSTVWKPKSTDATKIEPSLSNGHFSGSHEQYIDFRTGSQTSPKILGQSLDTTEIQSNSSMKFSNAEYGKSMSNQIQGPAEISSQYGGTSYGGTSYGGGNGNSAQPPSNLGNNLWANSNTSYSGPTANSSQPPGNSWKDYRSSYSRDIVKSTQPSGGSSSNSSTFYVRSSPNLSQPPSNSMNSHDISYVGNSMNSIQPSSTSWGNSNAPTGGLSWNSSEHPSDSLNKSSNGGYAVNSSQPSSNYWANNNSSCAGFTPNSSQLQKNSWNKYNTSYCGHTSSSTQPSSNTWANSNSSYGRSAPNSSQPPSDQWNNYTSQYDGHIPKPEESYSSSWSNNNKSSGGFTNNSSQPPSNSWNSFNTSHVRCSEASSNLGNGTSYSASLENSSWNNYKTQYGEHTVKTSEPSCNSGNKNASFGWSTESSQPPYDSWNHHNNNTNNTRPSTSYSSSSSVSNANSYLRYAVKSTQPSGGSWNNNSAYFEANPNPSHSSSNAWNNNRESWGSGFPQANSVTGDLPKPANTQNARQNESIGYSGKSLEGSCVKEPDPLDMSEEAKAERWFRRVAQIKDIQELSQIPDEDFPQIMPMRKGVNRFVVSKRKTPLERRLASQQYKRNYPVVSSEPEKERTNGEDTT